MNSFQTSSNFAIPDINSDKVLISSLKINETNQNKNIRFLNLLISLKYKLKNMDTLKILNIIMLSYINLNAYLY